MRSIYVDYIPILPSLDTGYSEFAMWVRAAKSDLPRSFIITMLPGGVIGLVVSYPNENDKIKKGLNIVNCKVKMYLDQHMDRIAGFDLPIHKFHSELHNLIHWLRNQVGYLNSESLRINYSIIANLLHRHACELFVPPQ